MKVYNHSYQAIKEIPKIDSINRYHPINYPVYEYFIWERNKGICRTFNSILPQVGTYVCIFNRLYIIKEMCTSNVTDDLSTSNRIVYDFVVVQVDEKLNDDKEESL